MNCHVFFCFQKKFKLELPTSSSMRRVSPDCEIMVEKAAAAREAPVDNDGSLKKVCTNFAAVFTFFVHISSIFLIIVAAFYLLPSCASFQILLFFSLFSLFFSSFKTIIGIVCSRLSSFDALLRIHNTRRQ